MNYCILLICLLILILCYKNKIEGFVPERNFTGLEDIFDGKDIFTTELIDEDDATFSEMRSKADVLIARRDISQCQDTGRYGDCSIKEVNHDELGEYYYVLPPKSLSNSDEYTNLSICSKTYPDNLNKMMKMKSMGQYTGYTKNKYIDRIRFVKQKDPLPVNPDFFMDNGGTFA